jgi:hypothetical protein
MKKQNTNNKLAFNKAAVTELNENQMVSLNGGTMTIIPSIFLPPSAVVFPKDPLTRITF